jgi:hypothetical protein
MHGTATGAVQRGRLKNGCVGLLRARSLVSARRGARIIPTAGRNREHPRRTPRTDRSITHRAGVAHAKAHVEDAHWIEACLKSRKAVAEEFERKLWTGAEGIDLPDVDDGELDPVEQGRAAT